MEEQKTETTSVIKKIDKKKIFLFIVGWFTVPWLSGGWLYEVLGTADFSEIWHKITNPSEWLDVFTIYTIAFLTFDYLPDRFNQQKWWKKFFYFVCYYLILLKIADNLFG